jgi:ferredoxin
MPYIITEPCIGVKDASCLEVCPVDCIATTAAADMYYIDPVTCIDCSYCESVCPVNAIFDEFTVPSKWREYIRKNREFWDGK